MSSRQTRNKKGGGFSATWIALAIVVAAGLFAYFYEYKGGQTRDEKKGKDAIVLKFEADKAARIEIVQTGKNVVLEKKPEGGWRLIAPIQDAADGPSVNNLLASLSSEKTIETVVEGDEAKPEKYGLTEPMGRIVVKTEDGKTHEIKIGAKSFDSNLYAQVDGEKKVILVAATWDVNLSKQPKDLRDKRLLRSDGTADFDSIAIQAGKTQLRLRKVDGKWAFAEPKSAPFPVSQDAVQAFLDQAGRLRAQDVVAEDKTDATVLKTTGLATPTLTVELKAGDKKTWLLKAAEGPAPAKGKPAPMTVSSSVISSDAPAVMQASKTTVSALAKTPEDFYDGRTPFAFQAADVKQAAIETSSGALEAKKKGETWELVGGPAGKELDSTKMADVVAKLAGMRVGRYLKGETPKGLAPARKRIVLKDEGGAPLFELVWGDEFHPPAKKAEGGKPFEPSPEDDAGLPNAKPPAAQSAYFAETHLKGGAASPAFGALTAEINGLQLDSLVREKGAPKPPPPSKDAPLGAVPPPGALPPPPHPGH